MKLKEFVDKFGRAECAAAIGISRDNLRQLIFRNREVEQLVDGRWILVTDKCKVFTLRHYET